MYRQKTSPVPNCCLDLGKYVTKPARYEVTYSVRQVRSLIKKIDGRKRILDLGCADGELLAPFVKQHDIFGVDSAYKLLRLAQAKGITTKVADLEKKIPYPKNFFDYIVIHQVLEHIIKTDLFLSECNRVLKKEGILILTFPNVANPISFLLLILGYAPHQAARYRSVHLRDFTLKTVKYALRNNGFSFVKNYGGPLLIGHWQGVYTVLTKIWPILAVDITLLAKKVKNVKPRRNQIYDFYFQLRD